MTPYKKRMNPFIQRMVGDMQLRNLADATIDAYTYHVDKFCRHFGKPADQLGPEEIRQFQLYLVHEKKASWSSFNQAVCGLRFLYEVTLQRPWEIRHIPFGKRPKKLPTVLGQSEVDRLLSCVPSIKHQTCLLTLYAARRAATPCPGDLVDAGPGSPRPTSPTWRSGATTAPPNIQMLKMPK